jgi:PEGA domain
MSRNCRSTIILIVLAAAFAPSRTTVHAQRRRQPLATTRGVAVNRSAPVETGVPVRGRSVVFVGGYFYDPWFGPYPWWSAGAYPYAYYPVADRPATLRVLVTPKQAAVYVDGFYAGIVDDFDGYFQGLPLPPGGHEVTLFLEGFRTVRRRIYFAPGSTFKLQDALPRLAPGERSDPPAIAPAVPVPPSDSYVGPRTPPPTLPEIGDARSPVIGKEMGSIAVSVRPSGAEVFVDHNAWTSSDGTHLVLQLPPGSHLVDIAKDGYQPFSADVEVRQGVMLPLNVELTSAASK